MLHARMPLAGVKEGVVGLLVDEREVVGCGRGNDGWFGAVLEEICGARKGC